MNNGCLCTTCTCTGCHEECFGHCNACGDLTTDCNSYQTDGEKYSSFSSKNDDTQPKNEVKTKAATSESIKEVLAARVKQVADSEKLESMVNERVAEKTAMYEAQMRFLKEQANDAERRAQSNQNSTYMAAAEFAEQAAATIHGIRTAFWTLAKELSDTDFAAALEPLDEAVQRIYNREWEDEQYLEDEDDAN